MKKSFKIDSVFTDIYFEDRKQDKPWKLSPRSQPSRTRAPIDRTEQLDDIMKPSTIRRTIPIGNDMKTHLEMGIGEPTEPLKEVVDNSGASGVNTHGVPGDMREITTYPKTKPAPKRRPQDTRREFNVEWLDKLSSSEETYTLDQAKDIGDSLGIDWATIDIDQFVIGLGVEMEHTSDPETSILTSLGDLGKAVWSHLKELPDYYTRLTEMEKESSESVMLVPYSDIDDGFHRTKLKVPGEGHRPFMRDKKPGEGLSKIPIYDLPDKPFFETSPRVLKRYRKSFNISAENGPSRKFSRDTEFGEAYAELVNDSKYKEDIDKRFNLSTEGEWFHFEELYVPKEARGARVASELMADAISWADNNGVNIYTTIVPETDGLSEYQIIAFNKRYGFVDGGSVGKYTEMYRLAPVSKSSATKDLYKMPPGQLKDEGNVSSPINRMLDSAEQIWRDAGLSREEVKEKWLNLRDKLLKAETKQFIKIYEEYLKDPSSEETYSADKGHNPQPYYGDTNVYPYRGTGPAIGISTQLNHILNSDPPPGMMNKESIKSFDISATERPTVSDEAYEVMTEKGYAFKNYQLSSEQIIDAIDEGKDLALLLKKQQMTVEQRARAINIAIEKGTSLIYIYEHEQDSMDEHQKAALRVAMYEKAASEGTNLVFVLENFELESDKKNTLIVKGLSDGIGLHYLFKNNLLSPKQRDYAVSKAMETGFGLLDLLKYVDLTSEQETQIIDKAIERGIALIYILKRRNPTKEQQSLIFTKALKEGKGYYYILRKFKLDPEQVKIAIRKSRDNEFALRYLVRYQDLTVNQRKWTEQRLDKLVEKKRKEREKQKEEYIPYKQHSKDDSLENTPLNVQHDYFDSAQEFFVEADDDQVEEMYEAIDEDDPKRVEELIREVSDYRAKKSFTINSSYDTALSRVREWITENKDSEDFAEELDEVIDEELEDEEELVDDDAKKDNWKNRILQKIHKELGTDTPEEKEEESEEELEEEKEVEEEEEIVRPTKEELLGAIRESAKTRKLLWIKYRDKKGNQTERNIEPWELRDIYLFAHDPGYAQTSTSYKKNPRPSDVGTRQFILAAIQGIEKTTEPYQQADRWEMRI